MRVYVSAREELDIGTDSKASNSNKIFSMSRDPTETTGKWRRLRNRFVLLMLYDKNIVVKNSIFKTWVQ